MKTALNLFDIIHSVDSLRLAEAISRAATKPVPVLLEVNVSGEPSKYGLRPEEVEPALAKVRALPNIDVQGLMTVAPLVDDPEEVRPVFRRLRELAQGARPAAALDGHERRLRGGGGRGRDDDTNRARYLRAALELLEEKRPEAE